MNITGVTDPGTGITHPGTGIAEPGDIIFVITHYPRNTLMDMLQGKGLIEKIRVLMMPWWKPWLGLHKGDLEDWHVAIYKRGKKRRFHKRINLWVVHSASRKRGCQATFESVPIAT